MRMSFPTVRFLVLVAVAALGVSFLPAAQASDPTVTAADKSAIRQVVQSQLDAFQKDDGAKAFSYASPSIHSIFESSDNFMSMVKSGYAPVYRPRNVQFGPLENIEGVPVQHVFLVGPDGLGVDALYYMEREPDGTWRINGCELKQGSSA
jgi:hypothetical protein